MVRVGVIGAGRIGIAIIKGLISSGFPSSRIVASTKSLETAERVRELGVRASTDNKYVASNADIVILSVKPSVVLRVARELRYVLKDRVVVSVAALVPRQAIVEAIDSDDVYRAMPNVAVEVSKSFTALAPRDVSSGYGANLVSELFSLLGEAVWTDERVLDYLTLISASMPALIAELADAMVMAALYIGVPYDIARKAVGTVLEGVGSLARRKCLCDIRDSVVTPGGVTISMLREVYKQSIKSKLFEALANSCDRYVEFLEKYREKLLQ